MGEKPRSFNVDFPKPRNSAGRNLKAAIGVGVGLGALVLVAVYLGPWAWYPVVAVAAAVATWEVSDRLKETGYIVQKRILIIGGQAMVWASMWFGVSGVATGFVATALAIMFSRLFRSGAGSAPQNYLRDTAVSLFVLTWIPMFASFAAMIGLMHSEVSTGRPFIITFMLCVVASDTGGYVAGVLFGKHPMAPTVSPKKSWEGFAGSVLTAALAGALSVEFLIHHSWLLGIALGVLLAVCATLGDLVESQVKRDLGIKDMAATLPGHGGMMDRLDGMLPAAMVTWLLLNVASLPTI